MPYEWTNDDADTLIAFCSSVGCDVSVPLHVWAHESDNDPTAHNPNGDASGLFQLMPETAKDLGYDISADPHLAEYRALSVAHQLQWAVRYYAPHKLSLSTIAGFYAATFLPAMAHTIWLNPEATICGLRGPYSFAYRDNPGFDPTRKGYITGEDLEAAATRAYGPRAQSIAALVARRADTQPDITVDLGADSEPSLPTT
jgi:hypothetical protein